MSREQAHHVARQHVAAHDGEQLVGDHDATVVDHANRRRGGGREGGAVDHIALLGSGFEDEARTAAVQLVEQLILREARERRHVGCGSDGVSQRMPASQDIGDEIRARAAQGVTVGGILEYNKTDPEATNPRQVEQVNAFLQAGVDVRLDSGTEVMNHKLMIIDGNIILMGSYDFTDKAETENDENVLIIHSEIIAQKFMEEFLRIQARAQP